MLKAVSFAVLMLHIVWFTSASFAGGYPGYTELLPTACVAIDQQRAGKLPQSWQKYVHFTKICPLQKSPASKSAVFIVSIWAEDYLQAKKSNIWEEFPFSIIVDDNMNVIGNLPVIFPVESPTEPAIYFGKWRSSVPTEIRVDVYDPTVVGDHYYPPLVWNEKQKRYSMKNNRYRQGTRPKH